MCIFPPNSRPFSKHMDWEKLFVRRDFWTSLSRDRKEIESDQMTWGRHHQNKNIISVDIVCTAESLVICQMSKRGSSSLLKITSAESREMVIKSKRLCSSFRMWVLTSQCICSGLMILRRRGLIFHAYVNLSPLIFTGDFLIRDQHLRERTLVRSYLQKLANGETDGL